MEARGETINSCRVPESMIAIRCQSISCTYMWQLHIEIEYFSRSHANYVLVIQLMTCLVHAIVAALAGEMAAIHAYVILIATSGEHLSSLVHLTVNSDNSCCMP